MDWIEDLGPGAEPEVERLAAWASQAVSNSEAFFALPPSDEDEYVLEGDRLAFPSAVRTPHEENNTVRARYFPDASPRGRRRAVLVLPQWNADAEGHVIVPREGTFRRAFAVPGEPEVLWHQPGWTPLAARATLDWEYWRICYRQYMKRVRATPDE